MSSVAAAALERGYQELAIDAIRDSGHNPRRRFDAASLEELAQSIRQAGILNPILVRATPDGPVLIAGARRLRAAKLAALTTIPAIVRELTDAQALELQIIENLQREDVHPLDEADGYAALQQADRAYTVEAVAAKVGRSPSYVYQRLKLLELIPACREAFEQDEITAAHAVRLARLAPAQQKDALRHCFHDLFNDSPGNRKPAPVALLDRWIADKTQVDPANREELQHYLPAFAEQLAEIEPEATLLQLSDTQMPGFYLGRKDHGLVGRASWKEVKGEKACAYARRGAVVHGGPLRVLWVCAKKGCPKHWPVAKAKGQASTRRSRTASSGSTESWEQRWKREEQERARQRARWDRIQPLAMAAIAKTLTDLKISDEIFDSLVRTLVEYSCSGDELKAAFDTAGMRLTMARLPSIVRFCEIFQGVHSIDTLKTAVKRFKLGIDVKAIVAAGDALAAETPAAKPTTTTSAKKTARKK